MDKWVNIHWYEKCIRDVQPNSLIGHYQNHQHVLTDVEYLPSSRASALVSDPTEWFRAATVGIMCDTMCHVLVHFCEGTSALCNARPPDRASRCMSSSPLLLPCQHLVGIESGVQGILDSNGYGAPLRKSCIRIVSSSQPMKNPSTWIRTFLKYVDSWVVMNIWTEFMLQWIFALPQVPLTLIWLRCCHRCFISLQHFFFSLQSFKRPFCFSQVHFLIFYFALNTWALSEYAHIFPSVPLSPGF